jgi:hypothetical protein
MQENPLRPTTFLTTGKTRKLTSSPTLTELIIHIHRVNIDDLEWKIVSERPLGAGVASKLDLVLFGRCGSLLAVTGADAQ